MSEKQAFKELVARILKSVRGRSSKRDISQKLGLPHNQFSRWEGGKVSICWDEFVRLCEFRRLDLRAALGDAFGVFRETPNARDLAHKAVMNLGNERIIKSCGIGPIKLRRLANGKQRLKLEDALALISLTYYGIPAFLDQLLKGREAVSFGVPLDAAETQYRARLIEEPMLSTVRNLVTLAPYRNSPAHDDVFLAKELGISVGEAKHLVQELIDMGILFWDQGKLRTLFRPTIHAAPSLDSRPVDRFWLKKIPEKFSRPGFFEDAAFPGKLNSLILSVHSDSYIQVRDVLDRALREIIELAKDDHPADDELTYLGIQLVPITRKDEAS